MTNLIELDLIDLVATFGLIAIAIGLSRAQQLGLEGQLLLAAGRTVLQLLAVGYVLAFVFALATPWAVLVVFGVMIAISSTVTRNRISQKLPRLFPLAAGALLTSSVLTLSYTLLLIIQPPLWYDPQYLIPLAGIILGNAVNGATLAGERLVSTIKNSRLEIETHLSLGATPQQAIAPFRRAAIRAGLLPTLNQMMIVGVVTLPGIFTGQLLGGVDPLSAASYQILILFLLAFANLVTTLLVTTGISRQFFTQDAQLIESVLER